MVALAEELGISDHIRWHTEWCDRPSMRALYQIHDVLILPSFGEAIGSVVPEAMACGCATITSDTVGANTYVEKEKTGIIFKTGDAESLSQAICSILKNDAWNAMGIAAADRMHTAFSLNSIQDRFREAIKLQTTA
jgi:GalNAc-alpha-(1->4)-GalNAc-alpha-(1->3)-diNAcBac-PP-undecaprenol alpha-1,4-N-acetyl-D-galactosaminyltransferase